MNKVFDPVKSLALTILNFIFRYRIREANGWAGIDSFYEHGLKGQKKTKLMLQMKKDLKS